jgi:glycine cleavage system H protein
MTKWKDVRVRQALIEEIQKSVEKGQFQNLSEFVSEAIQSRLQELAKQTIPEYIERDERSRLLEPQAQLYYTPKHTWVEVTPQGRIRLGVSEYFGKQLKGIVFVDTAQEGTGVHRDEPFGTIETVARWPLVIHDLCSPTDGKIVRVNKDVINDPYTLNGDPHQWIVEILPDNPEYDKKVSELLDFEEYNKLVAKLEERPYSPPSDAELAQIVSKIKQ